MDFAHVVVTGGSGRLGRHVVERLKGKHRLSVIDTRPPADPEVGYMDVSILDTAGLRRAFPDVDAVVHLAAVPNPRTSSPELCFTTNTVGTWSVLQAAEDAGVRRVVVASSDAATGLHYNPKDWAPLYLPVDEQHAMRPSEVYSLTKEITECIARSFAVRGKLEVLAIRPGHIVFEPEYPELGERGSNVQNYHLWGYVAPQDVAQGFELALALEDGSYDCFFIGAADGLNTRPTLELIMERFGRLPEIRRPEIYAANPTAGVFDITHAVEKLGYRPQFTWRDFGGQAVAARKSA
ncbi:NAD(P)-dependent oxidoreductase [Xanthobacter autotrophicus DSM 431]|uniref:NAD-dependent epimerase/dehydratase family protein n=1 Tax=Xanthobacter nonsaccharivorans TaxID=3119912 RepID=UPI003729E94A